MRDITSKISYLESYELAHSSKELIISSPLVDDSFISQIRKLLIFKLLGIKNSVLYTFSFKDSILAERLLLESYKESGFIESYGEGVVYCDYPRLNFFGIVLFIEKDKLTVRSWGYSLPYEEKSLAIKKSFWEALERQSSYYLPSSSSIMYPDFKRGDASFLYDFIPKFNELQIRNNPSLLSEKKDLQNVFGLWVKSLTKSGKTFLPADCFFWGKRVGEEAKFFQDLTTSGSGGGYTVENATLSALYEAIERDLFMLYWYAGTPPQLIDLSLEKGSFFDYIKDAKERYNLEIYFFDVHYDINIPACVCIVIDPVLNLVSVGAKVSYNTVTALQGSCIEALATLCSIRSDHDKNAIKEESLIAILKDVEENPSSVNKIIRTSMYSSPLGIKMIKDLWINSSEVSSFKDFDALSRNFSSTADEFKYITDQFKKLTVEKGEGYHIYTHTFSSLWTKLFGYKVVHVFIPSFLKLNLSEVYRATNSSRLSEFIKKYKKESLSGELSSNVLPHPLP